MTQKVDTNSTEFKAGVEAGLNSSEDTINWQAGNELGQELKDGGADNQPATERSVKEPPMPLFLRHTPGANKGNPQDEKDEGAE